VRITARFADLRPFCTVAWAPGSSPDWPTRAFRPADLRDWLVLALISGDQAQRTQLEIATQLGIDKSTLVPLLGRLERDGLIVRTTSECDRRVCIPQATPAGVKVVRQVAIAREAAIKRSPRHRLPIRAGELSRHAVEDRRRRSNAEMSY